MLTPFYNLSIRNKLHVILMGTSAVSAFLISLGLYIVIINLYRISYEKDLENLAGVIGYNCEAALSFNIKEDAQNILKSLRTRESVVNAFIYDNNGGLFAYYSRNDALPLADEFKRFPPPKLASSAHMEIIRDIVVDNNIIGRIYLQDDRQTFREFRRLTILFQIGAVLTAMLLTYLLADWLQGLISKPITSLSFLASRVSDEEDFSLRATKSSDDEIGDLIKSINTMLDKIEASNRAIQLSEKRFRTLVNQGVDAFFLHDIDGNILDVNRESCVSLGYTREELLAMTVEDIDRSAFNEEFKEKLWGTLGPDQSVIIEGEHCRKDGSTFPVEVRVGLLELEGKNLYMAIARDLTQRKTAEREKIALETKLQQAQKMESIGTLAGGIAHDFNNILTPIFGYLELAQQIIEDEGPLKIYLRQVVDASERARDLVRQILTFSRQESGDMNYIEVHLIIKEALKLMRSSIPTTIEIRQNVCEDCGYVLANSTQIHQVLMNLCTNAYQSMRESGGVLAVTLKPVVFTADEVAGNPELRPGRYVHLEVSDTGHGMDKKTLEKIFEPYFTTKIQGEGTGLGLSVVHGIVVKNHGGFIRVYSEIGQGTVFHVYLPAVDRENVAEDVIEEDAPGGLEHILVVDDEGYIVNMSRLMLTSLGYRVTTCLSPEDALGLFKADPGAYDLVITDMTMPNMTGYVLSRRLLAIRPDLPVIMCTGFSELINEENAKAAGIREYIMKPFSIKVMNKAIRRALDGEEKK